MLVGYAKFVSLQMLLLILETVHRPAVTVISNRKSHVLLGTTSLQMTLNDL